MSKVSPSKKINAQKNKKQGKNDENLELILPPHKENQKKEKSKSKQDSIFLIIDSHALIYRAYYALQNQNLTHPITGQPTFAIHGFFRMFLRLLIDIQPAHCALVWDHPSPNFRYTIYKDYKATRKPMPDDLRTQIEEVRNLTLECGFYNIDLSGYEADDIIGTLSKHYGTNQKNEVLILSNDKDCFQLIDENVNMLRTNKGTSDFIRVDAAWVEGELGVNPKQIIDYMALIGDSSDNVPGVVGVGPKSAVNLIQNYKNLEGVYKNIEKINPKGLQTKLKENYDKALLSKELVTIKTDIQEILTLPKETFHIPDIYSEMVMGIFRDQGYNQIYNELNKASKNHTKKSTTSQENNTSSESKSLLKIIDHEINYQLIQSNVELENCLKEIEATFNKNSKEKLKEKFLVLDTESTGTDAMQAQIVGLSLCAQSKKAYYIPLLEHQNPLRPKEMDLEKAKQTLRKFLEDPTLKIIGQNIKYDYLLLYNFGIIPPVPYFDTMIASYLCNPIVRRHNMDDMAMDLLGYETITYNELVGKGAKQKNMIELEPALIRDYACEDADITYRLYLILKDKLEDKKLSEVFYKIEMPLLWVIEAIERVGVLIDKNYFIKLAKEFNKRLEKLERNIYDMIGYEFNIHSTRELQKVLYEELKLPQGRKIKTGYSTDQEALEFLKGKHIVVDSLLEHRKYSKLNSTYIEALPLLINPKTGRLHTSLNQTIAATGRLSSINPNLQNIPIREESGRAIRRGFIAPPLHKFISLDYSQVELRIMAHFSEDPLLIEALTNPTVDIHRSTASALFQVTPDDVTNDMRSFAKTVNFSIIYGVTKYGLANSLKIDQKTATLYIERFFEKYPKVRTYMDHVIAYAREHGYVQTLSGRIRQIPEINSSNHFRREGAERSAINSPIQGTSADIIKIAMIEIAKEMKQQNLKSEMILQVHDELLFHALLEEKDFLISLAKNKMENAVKLKVPLLVNCGEGDNWDEAH